jgi:hypothetical protein
MIVTMTKEKKGKANNEGIYFFYLLFRLRVVVGVND